MGRLAQTLGVRNTVVAMQSLRIQSWDHKCLKLLQQTGPLLAQGPHSYDCAHGTAFLIGHRLALTATHVLTGYLQHIHDVDPFDDRAASAAARRRLVMSLVLLIPSKHRKPLQLEVCGTKVMAPGDLTLLQLASRTDYPWPELGPYPELRLTGPRIGENVWGFGYPNSRVRREGPRKNAVLMSATPAVGSVEDVTVDSENPISRRLPRFQTNANFLPGISGGPIVDAGARVCGVISSSITFAEEESPVSYGSILWPIASASIANRRAVKPSARSPRNIVASKIINAVDFKELPDSARNALAARGHVMLD